MDILHTVKTLATDQFLATGRDDPKKSPFPPKDFIFTALKLKTKNSGMSNRRAILELTGQLYLLLKRSETAYRDYLAGGKTFHHAKILKYYNDKTRSVILEKGFILPAALQSDALLIVRHIDYWMLRWNDLASELNPAPNDEFVFPNDITFPRDAAKNIEQEYHTLKLELADAR